MLENIAAGARTPSATVLHTLERGLALLEAVAASDGTATAKALSRRLDLKIGTCYHLLRTLRAGGYIVRLPGGRYDVGPRASSLSRHLQRRSGPAPELVAILAQLHARTRETSYLSGWHHGVLRLQHYVADAPTDDVTGLDVGYAAHMHARASCKAVLACLPDDQLEAILSSRSLERLTPHTITDFAALTADLALVRRRGYALDQEEFTEGVACVSAPFFAGQIPAGAFTVSVSIPRGSSLPVRLITPVRAAAELATGMVRSGRLSIEAPPVH
ncbi:IclR family transcriptional regulator [Streptomyces sp. 150FB]|uniref:IclR family transcriptional regulator n=1 Tax=Streptomyces sp. 150FB TaxID=1576605 RepID=UPI000697DB2A|nr:IclR family transcriptional regulator [Streptomyces sp. 150FB]